MNRRELNISDKKLYEGTKEDIILKSPMKIPSKELQDLKDMKNINITTYAYYDIAKTEQQAVTWQGVNIEFFDRSFPSDDLIIKLGNFNDV